MQRQMQRQIQMQRQMQMQGLSEEQMELLEQERKAGVTDGYSQNFGGGMPNYEQQDDNVSSQSKNLIKKRD